MKLLRTALVITVAAAALGAQAADAAENIDKRQAAQRHSIRQGVQDGSLTRPEAHRLAHSQARMERKEQYFRSDGELTRRERANLHVTADRNRGKIYRQRHDDQVRDSQD